MRPIALLLCAGFAAGPMTAPSVAQSSAAAAGAFQDAVVSICVPAVTGGAGVNALPSAIKARVQASSDVTTRQQAGASADEKVWGVVSAKGVVLIREKAGRCVVSVEGLPVVPTILGVAQALSASGLERLAAAPPPNGFGQSLMGKGVMVQLNGSEPGMPGHTSRTTVVTATVFAPSAR